ncbi:MAG TPA: hypothetical protein VIS94_14680 [Desulfomonilia bacterium]
MVVEDSTERKWQKPELTILIRNMSEEAVLTGCKAGGYSGPDTFDSGCGIFTCADCSGLNES